ncbi:DUF5615 family PIN-like protein [Scytonema hofmannii]|uniref:DUF5615 family PIN-like protein n=1 Tax=Scytonema hofmannii TaxID=34078 RepID=UPI00034CDCA5|nr:DUF5615 family PIN-like protein [Scytonema hofmannii]
MLRFLADENFNNQIVRGVLRRNSNIDIVRVQDVGLSEAEDPIILEWAAQQARVVLTHDVETMTNFAYSRVQAGLSMLGVFEVSRRVPVGLAIEEILLLAECSLEGEWEGQVRFLPYYGSQTLNGSLIIVTNRLIWVATHISLSP